MISPEWSMVMNPKVRTGFDLVTNKQSIWLEYFIIKKIHGNFLLPMHFLTMQLNALFSLYFTAPHYLVFTKSVLQYSKYEGNISSIHVFSKVIDLKL